MKNISKVIYALTVSLTLCAFQTSYAVTNTHHIKSAQLKTQPKTQQIDYSENLSALTPTLLREAVNGYLYATQQQNLNIDSSVLTIVDFTQPSYKKRMWVIDLKTGKVLLAMHVAQGKNTGKVFAKHFSNQPRSLESSPGIFVTDGEYFGEHGKSMRIDGLEKGINSNALQRAVVIHSAWYMTPSFIIQNGYAGRSWGCFAVNPQMLPKLLSTIHHHSVLFAFAPSENNDANVDHALSSEGKKIVQTIQKGISSSNGNEVTQNTTTSSGGVFTDIKDGIEKL